MAVIDEHPVISGSPATVRCSQEQLRFSQQLIPLSSGRQPSRTGRERQGELQGGFAVIEVSPCRSSLTSAWPKAAVPECLLSRRCWGEADVSSKGLVCFYARTPWPRAHGLRRETSARLPLLLSPSSESPDRIYVAMSERARCGGRALLVIGKLAIARIAPDTRSIRQAARNRSGPISPRSNG